MSNEAGDLLDAGRNLQPINELKRSIRLDVFALSWFSVSTIPSSTITPTELQKASLVYRTNETKKLAPSRRLCFGSVCLSV